MTGIFSAGDTDLLRDAANSSDLFWARVRRSPRLMQIASALTVLLLVVLVLMLLGPDLSGLAWARREILAGVFAPVLVVWAVFTGWAMFKLLPGRNDRIVMGIRNWVRESVDPLEERMKAMSDDELRGLRKQFEQRLAEGETPEQIRAECYAAVREASRRAQNHRQFECQIIGARVIETNGLAEMRTGEGKTIVCYMANYMKVLRGLKVHMVTVNDYLVQRDASFAKPIFDLLGVSVGFITANMATYGPGVEVRRANYECDITYGTNSEFGFDYLRDNMKSNRRDQMQSRQDFAVVDEVDSILIDEARTPLIISGPAQDDVEKYRVADNVARSLIKKQEAANRDLRGRIDDVENNASADLKREPKFRTGVKKFRADPMLLSSDEADMIGLTQYFIVELDSRKAHMTEVGAKAAQAEMGIGTFYEARNMNWPHYLDNALRAHLCYERDKEYVVQDGLVVIVDEFTGRLMEGRQWSDGLHQAVEAKERVEIKKENQTLATITLQNLFKMYKQLAGMTGTAMTEADEFMKIYKLEVLSIPTNKPIRRVDYNDKIYKSKQNKYDAIVEEIRSYTQDGHPADPWSLYDMLKQAKRRLLEVQRAARSGKPVPADIGDPAPQLAIIDEAIAKTGDMDPNDKTLEEAYLKLAGEQRSGRPVLVGTVSVESSERLSQELSRRFGIAHEVLNAKNHAREADIIAKAGHRHESNRGGAKKLAGNCTIATNMAGRGTDIKLGPGVADVGGLHVVGTERHESRRIDNQLRGRCGRQGDPGSSRFFLSLEDDLLRLFMAEWMLKMLARFGMVEGMPIESRQLTRNIEAAQKKVEERNFGIRKNLLEYDEVMDFQRKTFYELRQRVVEGRELSGLIWEFIDSVVDDGLDRFFDPAYPARCAAEWAAHVLGVQMDATRLDTSELPILTDQVRDMAQNELRAQVQRVFGEYIESGADPEEWDTRGFVNWASQYGLHFSQREVKEALPEDLLEKVVDAALAKLESADLSGLEPFVDKAWPKQQLCLWARERFGLVVEPAELERAPREEVERIVKERMREAYRRREIEYPVGAVMEFAAQRGGSNRQEVFRRIAAWVKRKYSIDLAPDFFEGKTAQQVFQELRSLNEEYMLNGRMDPEIDAALRDYPGEQLINWAKERFGAVMESTSLDLDGDLRAQLKRCAYEMLRFELTALERLVILNQLDSVWKDHMYSMDLLRQGIFLRGYAERDPKIEYKREGTRLFNETMSSIRERVADVILRINISPSGGDDADAGPRGGGGPDLDPSESPGSSPLAAATEIKADATNAGFGGNEAQQAAAMSPQGEAAKPQTIRRDVPKVGRNDPCPCGSGKKYKACHGKGG